MACRETKRHGNIKIRDTLPRNHIGHRCERAACVLPVMLYSIYAMRMPKYYDDTFNYLKSLGLEEI